MTAQLLVERHGRVLQLTISNPTARNALHPSLYPQATGIFRAAMDDESLGAIVLCGDGAHFCGGGDLRRLQQQRSQPEAGQVQILDALHDWVEAMRDCPVPVIAAVEGAAAGGGFSVALGCDLIVAAEDARFVMSYVRIGLSPDGGGSDALARALPPQAALELLLDGDVATAARLQALGLVNRVVAPGTAIASALAWAERLAAGPRAAQQRIKQLVHAARGRGHRAQLDAERDAFVAGLYGPECGEGIDAFLTKRTPRFTP
ncbi:oxepin-CoA hydrolase, alternative type [Pseudorhodoferax sp. Leaf267]|uniref:oxepin-CoA hydrolase, alternative type n=1 Tax=Pseudorhodoferax sp. Leaf267 TaxID=1736316 RepID=UPI0006F853F8|nr:enoyl-CoA hydratase family protein [Pseudorhodoferax sp. Leaf267]KQP15150.1 enoyl-CoA hydratase [Pseudorhodoferax sp. Leaf267]